MTLGGLALLMAGCPGDVTPGGAFPGNFGGSTSAETPGITTFGGTLDPTTPAEGSAGVDSGDPMGTTMGPLDDTTAGDPDGGTTEATSSSVTDPGTTDEGGSTTTGDEEGGSTSTGMAGGSTSTGMAGGSTSTGMAGGSTSTGMGGGSTSTGMGGSSSTGTVCHDVSGNYDACLDDMGTVDTTPCNAPGASTCLVAGGTPPTAGACSIEGCTDICDCPAAPPTGTAPVACADVTGDPTNLLCHLDCSGGATCPVDMVCFGGFVCMWPTPGAAGDPYGDCFNNPTDICGIEGICLNDNVAAPTIGVCTQPCPGGVADCPPAPAGGAAPVTCGDLTGDAVDECFLDCTGGAACPAGMTCFANICVWN